MVTELDPPSHPIPDHPSWTARFGCHKQIPSQDIFAAFLGFLVCFLGFFGWKIFFSQGEKGHLSIPQQDPRAEQRPQFPAPKFPGLLPPCPGSFYPSSQTQQVAASPSPAWGYSSSFPLLFRSVPPGIQDYSLPLYPRLLWSSLSTMECPTLPLGKHLPDKHIPLRGTFS